MHDRVWLVPYIGLLANEDQAGDRIVRADPTASDILAGLPGPITSIDISRANVGEVHARGYDFSAEARFKTGFGTFMPRLDLTKIDEFRDKDLPLPDSPLTDRVGRAYPFATIPQIKAVASVLFQREDLTATISGRYHSAYLDWNGLTRSFTGRRIPHHVSWI